jgi:hypothetical protein
LILWDCMISFKNQLLVWREPITDIRTRFRARGCMAANSKFNYLLWLLRYPVETLTFSGRLIT